MEEVRQQVEELRALVDQPHPPVDRCKSLLSKLKIAMTKFNRTTDDDTMKKEMFISREILELAAIYSVKIGDDKGFERYVAQLKPYYNDFKHILPESTRRTTIMGLYLVYLLTEEVKIDEFHTELELIPDHGDRNIRYAIELERDIMEGRYNKLWLARNNAPDNLYIHFLDKLMTTVRSEIADCIEASYQSLKLTDIAKLLMFPAANEEFHNFIDQRGWMVTDNDRITFGKESGPNLELPSTTLINQMLSYAHEIERII